jgi:Na+-driven multidrug efflux pump
MFDDKDDNYISVLQWMLLMVLPFIPFVGLVLVIVMAFVGHNQTRKNYYRAMIAWVALATVVFLVLFFGFGAAPALMQHLRQWELRPH